MVVLCQHFCSKLSNGNFCEQVLQWFLLKQETTQLHKGRAQSKVSTTMAKERHARTLPTRANGDVQFGTTACNRKAAHDLKAFNLRERLRKKGIMTTWESRASSTKWSCKNTPLTTSLPGMPSCHHCYKQHCPIRTIIAIALPTSPTKDWVLSSKLFRKRNLKPTNFSGNRWRKGSLFMGSHRVTVMAK